MAKKKTTKRKKPSAARRKVALAAADAWRVSVRNAMEAAKNVEQAKAERQLKVFAVKLIAHISREAGLPAPPASVKRAAIARAKKKAAAATKKSAKAYAAAKKKGAARRKKAIRAAMG